MLIATLLALQTTASPAEARRPPDERVQTHGQNAVVKHDPAGARIDIVAEDAGSCPGPGPTTIMRLRSAEPRQTIVVVVARHVNRAGTISMFTAEHVVAPMAAIDLGCLAEPAPGGGRPLSSSEWTIMSARAR